MSLQSQIEAWKLETLQRRHLELTKFRQNYNEKNFEDRKSWISDLHEVEMRLVDLESEVRRLRKDFAFKRVGIKGGIHKW